MTSKVTIPHRFSVNVNQLDPSKIIDPFQSNFLGSMYATLLYYNSDGKIVGGAAASYHVDGKNILFKIRDDIMTVDEHRVTAEDAYLSFKRLLVLDRNTHGKLSNFLNYSVRPKSLNDQCPCISFTGNELRIELKSEIHVSLFLTMVANPDFSIIPKNSFEHSGNLKITDRRNTSGAYYINSSDDKSTIFKRNPKSYLITEENPEEVEVLHNITTDKIDFLNKNVLSVIPTFAVVMPGDLKRIEDPDQHNIYKTLPIILTAVKFNPVFRKTSSRNDRLKIGTAIKNAYLARFKDLINMKETFEAFTIFGESSLNDEQAREIKSLLSKAETEKPSSSYTADIYSFFSGQAESLITEIPWLKYKKLERYSDLYSESADVPDAFVISGDASGYDNASLLGYVQSLGIFGMSDSDYSKWLQEFICSTKQGQRLEKFQELHFEMLKEGFKVPIGFTSLYGVARKPWKIEAPPMFPGTRLWMIKHE